MKRLLLAFLILPTISFATETVTTFDKHEWYYADKTLRTWKHQPFPFNGRTYEYSLAYTTPAGTTSNTDLCELSSPNSISCITGDSLAANADTFSVTLHSKYEGTITYYENGHLPEKSPLSGTWVRETKIVDKAVCYNNALIKIVIPYHKLDAQEFENVEEYSENGYMTSTYYIVKDKYTGHLAFSPTPNSTSLAHIYLYDSNNQPIDEVGDLGRFAKLNDTYNSSKTNVQCNLVKSN